jgi:acyl dehydratase
MGAGATGGLAERVGSLLGVTSWECISQDEVVSFGRVTRATEWIHSDAERAAREGPFGVPVVHGYFVLALATHFVTQLLGPDLGVTGVNVGLDRVRFVRPVPVGSRVRARGTLLSADATELGWRTVVELVFECSVGEQPVCVAQVVSLLVPSTSNDADIQ